MRLCKILILLVVVVTCSDAQFNFWRTRIAADTLLLYPSPAPTTPDSGSKVWHDSATGRIKVKYSNGVTRFLDVEGGGGGGIVGNCGEPLVFPLVVAAGGTVNVPFASPAVTDSYSVATVLVDGSGDIASSVWIPSGNTVDSCDVYCSDAGMLYVVVSMYGGVCKPIIAPYIVASGGVVNLPFQTDAISTSYVIHPILLTASGDMAASVWLPGANTTSSTQVYCSEPGTLYCVVSVYD